jgi:hypothetical protein
MSFEEFYETWWLDHQNNVLAPTPKEAMRQAWLAGRKAEKAAQQSVHSDVCPVCLNSRQFDYPNGNVGACPLCS